MKRFFGKVDGKGADPYDPALAHSCAGRAVNALTFIVLILSLGLWVTVFLVLKDQLFARTVPGNWLTDLTCLTFFGGLIAAAFIGALAGSFLRRMFWKILMRRRK